MLLSPKFKIKDRVIALEGGLCSTHPYGMNFMGWVRGEDSDDGEGIIIGLKYCDTNNSHIYAVLMGRGVFIYTEDCVKLVNRPSRVSRRYVAK